MEKTISNTKINDPKADVYQKGPSFDGNNYNTTTMPIKGNKLPNSLKKRVDNLAQHACSVSYGSYNIKR